MPAPTAHPRFLAALTSPEGRDATIYFIGAVAQRVGLFLFLPVLLGQLSVSEYGAFGLAQSGLALFPALLTLNIPATMTRLYFDETTASGRKRTASKLTAVCFALGAAATLVCLGLATRTSGFLASTLDLPEGAAVRISTLVLLGALGSAHLQMAYAIWRAERRAGLAAGANVLSTVLFLATGTALALQGRLSLVSIIACYSLPMLVVGLGASGAAGNWRALHGGPSARRLLKEALRYGVPILPYLVGLWVLAAGGRWIARAALSLEDTGYFTLASQVAAIVSLVGRAAYDAWSPRSFELFATGRSDDARDYLRTRGKLTVRVAAVLCPLLVVGVGLALPRFAPSYTRAATILPLMMLAPLLDIAYMSYHTELLGLKATKPIARLTVITILTFTVLGLAGAKALGLWGLAGAYVAAYGVQWLLAHRAVRRLRPRPSEPLGMGPSNISSSAPAPR